MWRTSMRELLKVKCADTQLGTQYNMKDTINMRSHTLAPEYHKCYVMDQCRMPEHAMLTLSLMENLNLSEYEVGSAPRQR